MDQPTRDTLSAIDRILAELADDVVRPGEFTAKEVQVNAPHMLVETITKRLDRKVHLGEMESRVAVIKGHRVKLYRYKD